MLNIAEIAENRALIDLIERLDKDEAAACVGGLLLFPEYHANVLRLKVLAHLIATFARGSQKITSEILDAILNGWLQHLVGPSEGPARDAFVVNVITTDGNRRILASDWETMDYSLEGSLTILESMPGDKLFGQTKDSLSALLAISEAILNRVDLPRNTGGTGDPGGQMLLPPENEIRRRSDAIAFSARDLDSLGISSELLDPFVLREEIGPNLTEQRLGNSGLERWPLLKTQNSIYLFVLPTSVAVAALYFLLQSLEELNLLSEFGTQLGTRQEAAFLDALSTAIPTRKRRLDLSPSLKGGIEWVSPHALSFDGNKAALFLLLHDDPRLVLDTSFTDPNSLAIGMEPLFSGYVARMARDLVRQSYQQGIVVVVLCGFGRDFFLPKFLIPPNWNVFGLRLSDLIAVSWMEESWLTSFWKLLRRVDEILTKGGATISGLDEHIDLFAYFRDYGRLVPLEAPYREGELQIEVKPVYLEKFRRTARTVLDRHAAFFHPDDSWREVQKLYPKSYFRELSLLPLYGSLDDARNQLLNAVVETDNGALWVHAWPTPKARWAWQLAYTVWGGLVIWLGRATSVLERRFARVKSVIVVRIDMTSIREWKAVTWDNLPGGEEEPVTVLVDHSDRMIIRLSLTFFRLLANIDNQGERELLRAFIRGFSELHKEHLGQAQVDRLITEIVPSTDAKFIHFFQAQKYY